MNSFHLMSNPQFTLGVTLQRRTGLRFYYILISPRFNNLGSRLLSFLSLIWCRDQSKEEDCSGGCEDFSAFEDANLDSLAYVNPEDAPSNEVSGFRMQEQPLEQFESLQQESLFAAPCESRCLHHCWTTERRLGNRCLVGCWQGGDQRGEHYGCDSEDCGED